MKRVLLLLSILFSMISFGAPVHPDFCKNGTIVKGIVSYIPSADGMECRLPNIHCLSNDPNACLRLTAPAEDFCQNGEVVNGYPNFYRAADGMECMMPNIHCVTLNPESCPNLSLARPCPFGTLVEEQTFIPSGDQKECRLVRYHCLTTDPHNCPQF